MQQRSLYQINKSDSPKEKCGICGIFAKEFEASRLVYLGLWALQHRGQEASGITSSDSKIIRTHKAEGLVAHVYSEENLSSLKGYIAIGHNRYGTSGGKDSMHSQPVINKGDQVALAHNGTLPSTVALQKFLISKKIKIDGLNDSELMQKALQYYMSEGSSIESAVKKCWPLFSGAFGLVLLTKNKLVAVRDEYGIRPLCLGKIGDGFAVASETCALDVMGATFVREIKPGEMVVIDNTGLHSYQIAKSNQKLDIFEFIYFARPDSVIMGKSVNSVRRQLGVQLAKEYIVSADMVVPVPDSSIPAAAGYSQTTGIPLNHALIKNRYIHRTFIRPEQHLRERDVSIKLNPLTHEIKGKEIVLIDDSIVRGTTSKKLVGLLKKIGAKKVHLLITCPPIRFPDFYGIDTPNQDKLIASKMGVDQIKDFIGADSLYYLSYKGMIEATGLPEKVFSTYHFTGEYPIPLGEIEKNINFSVINAKKELRQPITSSQVVGIGALNMDFFYKNGSGYPESKIGENFQQAGGAASNTLCALTQFGITTAAVGKIGEDPEGMAILKSLRKYNVDETFVSSIVEESGKSIVFVDSLSGKRTIHTQAGANKFLDLPEIPVKFLQSAKFLLLSTFLDEKQIQLQEKILKELGNDLRCFLWLDHHVLSYGQKHLESLLKYTDTIFIKQPTLSRLTGYEGYDGAQKLLRLGSRTVVIIHSPSESEIFSNGETHKVRSAPVVLKDETGISCAYAAGYLFGQFYGYSIKQSGFFGNVMASQVSEHLGCRTLLPTLPEFMRKRSLLQEEKNMLVIGSGGREHALAWKLSQSPKVKRIYAAPGNPGMSDVALTIPIDINDIVSLKEFVKQKDIDLTIVGPEIPLSKGIVDEFEKEGLLIFGPTKIAAEIETSKVFAKNFMKKFKIPTASFETFTNYEKAKQYLVNAAYPLVLKVDGLAFGKGVLVASSKSEAEEFLTDVMKGKKFGSAGEGIIIEEYLEGEEASILAFVDGENVLPLLPAQDHKRIYSEDKGPNTGGMGAYAPASIITPEILEKVMKEILIPTVNGMKKIGREYKGILFAGIMLTKKGPKVLEFNCRFGDPETQAILPLMKSDLLTIFESALQGNLDKINIDWKNGAGVCVVLAAGGYPENPELGNEIVGLSSGAFANGSYVFHAGTKAKMITSGGRVLGIFAKGDTLKEAIQHSYNGVQAIKFKDMQYRQDIGKKGLNQVLEKS